MIQRMFMDIKQVNINIYHLLCGGYNNARDIRTNSFTIKSITSFLRELCDEVKSEVSNIFGSDVNKLTLGQSEHELSEISKLIKPVKVSNVLNKGEDNMLLPKSTYKPSANTSRDAGEGSSRLHPNPKGKAVDAASNKSKTSVGISEGSRSLTFELSEEVLRETERSAPLRPNLPTPSSVYSPYDPLTTFSPTQQQGDFPLYDYDSQGSDLATPRTMPPLFGGSNASGSVRTSIHSLASQSASQSASQRNSDYPAPLNIRQNNQANMALRRNSVLPEPTSSELGYSSSAFTRSNTSINNGSISSSVVQESRLELGQRFSQETTVSVARPYVLSGNSILPNITFTQTGNVTNTIPLDPRYYTNRNILPILPRNYESNLDNVANTPRIDDPCSVNYQSKHGPQFVNETRTPSFNRYHYHYKHHVSDLSQEIEVKKPGLKGKVKLGFKTLGNKFSNGISKIESAYVHYETVSKRHII
jgi:hypothetical protein